MAQWYYANDGKEHGPIDESEFGALTRSGIIGPRTLVWTDTMKEWEPAHMHVEGVSRTPSQPAGVGRPAVPEYADTGRDYRRQSGMKDAFQQFFARYFDFKGRSNRGEFWWFMLDSIIIGIVLGIVDAALFGEVGQEFGVLGNIWSLAVFIPTIALTARRLHDIDKSGWWQLLLLLPVIGWIILIVWWCRVPDGPNRFG
ncbi:Uncharacterized membrane protein YhaH, DUF805 family [Loktanella sp. DSM 29012]|uniref:DUF805 domain-containing protein n=1 Tax=Loktanella sp. DSM 29012 TaxID=1881056 RepID=UPI0008B6F8F3|nr:DUF805 domain-containing protein [Loktanella sp. DSM 29012]SEQ63106.1 Uncharacterized membrane protein YhaH, DUF805 family [Loktanella sp. DSM 29012]